MNTRLQQLAQRGGIELDKVQRLLELYGGDEGWVEQILLGADRTQKAALASGIAYKAVEDDAGELDAIDQAYIVLRDALDGGDQAQIDVATENFLSTIAGGGMSGAKSRLLAKKHARPLSFEALIKNWDRM